MSESKAKTPKQRTTPPAQDPEPSPDEPLLDQAAHRYDFFQAIRLLERKFPKAARIGTRGPAGRERIRLKPSPELSFPTAELHDVRWQETGKYTDPRVEVETNFLGLVGSGTPLPLTYAQEILWEEDEQPQMRAFLDMFHHRLLSLLYRSWLLYRHEYLYEAGGTDRLTRALLDLVGISPTDSEAFLGIEPSRVLRYMGMFLMPDRPTGALEVFLSEELGTTVRVIPLTPRWINMPGDQVFRMDPNQRKKGFLGVDIVIGTRMIDRTGHITLEIGPVSYAEMDKLRPGQSTHRRLLALVRLFVRQPLDLELRVLVPANEIPKMSLGGPHSPRLGQTTHMGTPHSDPMVMTFNASISDGDLARQPGKQG